MMMSVEACRLKYPVSLSTSYFTEQAVISMKALTISGAFFPISIPCHGEGAICKKSLGTTYLISYFIFSNISTPNAESLSSIDSYPRSIT